MVGKCRFKKFDINQTAPTRLQGVDMSRRVVVLVVVESDRVRGSKGGYSVKH